MSVTTVPLSDPMGGGHSVLSTALAERTGFGEIPRLGVGAFPLSREERPLEEHSINLLHEAWNSGLRMVDTANSYHIAGEDPGHGESLIRTALETWDGDSTSIIVTTKGGREYHADGQRYHAGRPEQIVTACERSYERLGRTIDVYYFHRPDPDVPYEDSVGALVELCDRGLIRTAGISNANVDQIGIAHDRLGERLVAVQNEFSLWFRSSEPELTLCEQLDLAFVPWSPFGGNERAASMGSYEALANLASSAGISAYQLVLAWMLTKSPNMLPIPGFRRIESLRDSMQALVVILDEETLGILDGMNLV